MSYRPVFLIQIKILGVFKLFFYKCNFLKLNIALTMPRVWIFIIFLALKIFQIPFNENIHDSKSFGSWFSNHCFYYYVYYLLRYQHIGLLFSFYTYFGGRNGFHSQSFFYQQIILKPGSEIRLGLCPSLTTYGLGQVS